jgi:hypothetical protein
LCQVVVTITNILSTSMHLWRHTTWYTRCHQPTAPACQSLNHCQSCCQSCQSCQSFSATAHCTSEPVSSHRIPHHHVRVSPCQSCQPLSESPPSTIPGQSGPVSVATKHNVRVSCHRPWLDYLGSRCKSCCILELCKFRKI